MIVNCCGECFKLTYQCVLFVLFLDLSTNADHANVGVATNLSVMTRTHCEQLTTFPQAPSTLPPLFYQAPTHTPVTFPQTPKHILVTFPKSPGAAALQMQNSAGNLVKNWLVQPLTTDIVNSKPKLTKANSKAKHRMEPNALPKVNNVSPNHLTVQRFTNLLAPEPPHDALLVTTDIESFQEHESSKRRFELLQNVNQ